MNRRNHKNSPGVHVIPNGGFLKVHTDFPFHSALRLWRRVNVLLYLNDGWDSAWSGDLQLWDANLTRCHKYLSPVFNRMVGTALFKYKYFMICVIDLFVFKTIFLCLR